MVSGYRAATWCDAREQDVVGTEVAGEYVWIVFWEIFRSVFLFVSASGSGSSMDTHYLGDGRCPGEVEKGLHIELGGLTSGVSYPLVEQNRGIKAF